MRLATRRSCSPYGDLGKAYVGTPLAVLLNLVASLSLFAITLGTLNAAARIDRRPRINQLSDGPGHHPDRPHASD